MPLGVIGGTQLVVGRHGLPRRVMHPVSVDRPMIQ